MWQPSQQTLRSFPHLRQPPIYSDPNGLVPITQPILTDGFGHYDFYVLPGTYTVVVGLNGQVSQVYPDQSIGQAGGGTSGTVTSVGLVDSSGFLTITGSPVTSAGNISIAFATEPANKVFSGPSSGPAASPTFRSLVLADLPSIGFSNLTGNISVNQMNSGTSASSSTFWRGDGTWVAAGTAFSTSGQGWFFPDLGIIGANTSSSGQYTPANNDNEVLAYQFVLLASYTIRKISAIPNSAGGNGNASCAIYSFDGNTKLIDAGANAFPGTPGGSVVTVSITPVTLSPGVYWLGCSSTNHLMTSAMGFTLSSGSAGYFSIVNGSQVRTGKAANSMSGGAMPSTLGAISSISDPASGFARFLFEC